MLFDDSKHFYVADRGNYYQQGDIVLAPMVVLESSGFKVSPDGERPEIGQSLVTELWNESPLASESGRLLSHVRLCPALITTHDCTLDKEFNRQVEALRKNQQMKLDDAVKAAASNLSLDRYVNVAPLVPYTDAAPSSTEQLKQNQVVGYFPVCPDEERGVDGGVIDLLQEATIDRELIVARLAVLSDDARAALRYSLARHWVYRAPKLGFEFEAAIGKRIRDIDFSRDGTLAVELTLYDGSKLRFVQAPQEQQAGPERPGIPRGDALA